MPGRPCPAESGRMIERLVRVEERASNTEEKVDKIADGLEKMQGDIHAIRAVLDGAKGARWLAGIGFTVFLLTCTFIGWVATVLPIKIVMR